MCTGIVTSLVEPSSNVTVAGTSLVSPGFIPLTKSEAGVPSLSLLQSTRLRCGILSTS